MLLNPARLHHATRRATNLIGLVTVNQHTRATKEWNMARSMPLYRIKGMSGEFGRAAVVRVAAGALQMSRENKDNATIKRWINEHVVDFKWHKNVAGQINGALGRGPAGGRRGRRPKVERNPDRERLAAAIYLLKRLDEGTASKALDNVIRQAEEDIEAAAHADPKSVAAFVETFSGRNDAALRAVEVVEEYTAFTMPPAGTPEYNMIQRVVELAKDHDGTAALKKAIEKVKPNPASALIMDLGMHAKSALEGVKQMLSGEESRREI